MNNTTSFIYFEAMPLHILRPPSIDLNDPRLKDPSSFNHKWESWSKLYGGSIFDSIKKHGQIDPNIALVENGKWRVEPGQARWLAMHYLGIPHQKIVLCARKEDDSSIFLEYNHTFVSPKDLPNLFKHKAMYRGYDYIARRFRLELEELME